MSSLHHSNEIIESKYAYHVPSQAFPSPHSLMNLQSSPVTVRTIGRYALFDEIASGGMATVHLGRLIGPVGFSRTVAIKRLHAQFAKNPDFSAGFVDEARLAARIHHPNVVPTIDILAAEGELSLVMEYVEGDSLAALAREALRLGEEIPLPIISAIISGSLYGLHAAHEAENEAGELLHIVHRDISPQNILVGADGGPRIVDFGVAQAAERIQTTAEGQIKGKIAYMSPEQIQLGHVTHKTDIYAMGVVLWELLAGRRLFPGTNQAQILKKVLDGKIPPPSKFRKEVPADLERLTLRALSENPNDRFTHALEMAKELCRCVAPAPPTDIGDWVSRLARDTLTHRRRILKRVECHKIASNSPSLEQIVSSPTSEELLTLVDLPFEAMVESDSTQALTAGIIHEDEKSPGLFVPLILGLTAVASGIAVLLWSNYPQLAPSPEPSVDIPHHNASQQVHPLPGDLPQVPRAIPDDSFPKGSAAQTPVINPSASQLTSNNAPPPATKTVSGSAVSAKVARPATQQAKSPRKVCPKFIVDKAGIKRVNRKCWSLK